MMLREIGIFKHNAAIVINSIDAELTSVDQMGKDLARDERDLEWVKAWIDWTFKTMVAALKDAADTAESIDCEALGSGIAEQAMALKFFVERRRQGLSAITTSIDEWEVSSSPSAAGLESTVPDLPRKMIPGSEPGDCESTARGVPGPDQPGRRRGIIAHDQRNGSPLPQGAH